MRIIFKIIEVSTEIINKNTNKIKAFFRKHESLIFDICLTFSWGILSFACALITQDIVLTMIYILVTTLSSIMAKVCYYFRFEKVFIFLLETNNKWKYFLFIFFAVLPTAVGFAKDEIVISNDFEDLMVKMFDNLIPNLFGGLIVCSLICHLTRFQRKNLLLSWISSMADFFQYLIPFGFNMAFLNAINYTSNNEWEYTYAFNCFYLILIMFSGAFYLIIFALRLINMRPFDMKLEYVYPLETMFFTCLFLMSYGLPSVFLQGAKHEWILLLADTIMAIAIVRGIDIFIKRNNRNETTTLQKIIVKMFYWVTLINWGCSFLFRKGDSDNVIMQITAGIIILLCTFLSLFFVNRKQKEIQRT